ncbi:Cysteine desulfurase [Dirofilaria immitis]
MYAEDALIQFVDDLPLLRVLLLVISHIDPVLGSFLSIVNHQSSKHNFRTLLAHQEIMHHKSDGNVISVGVVLLFSSQIFWNRTCFHTE